MSLITLRLLAPLPLEQLQDALSGATHIVVIEQNHGGQLFHYLASQLFYQADISGRLHSFAKPGPVPFTSLEVVQFIEQAVFLNKQGYLLEAE